MPHLFFFSYARADGKDNYLTQFFDDLSNRIRGQLGLDPSEPVGFFDHNEIALGANWKAELHDALQTCPVMVSLYSPAYFNSEYCGREWEVFRRRQQLYVTNARANGEDVNDPDVIKPVIWIPLMKGQATPDAVGPLQYYMGDPEANENKVGLQRMRRRANHYEDSYDNFMENLKNQILAAQNFNLPPLPGFTDLDEISSAFHPAPNGTPTIQPANGELAGKGPQFVRFVCIAGNPTEFPTGIRKQEFYLTYGGPEWKPYYDDDSTPIMLVAQRSATNVGIISDFLPFGPTLAEEVRKAEDVGSLVVLFVDSWTAELPSYQSILRDFDRYNYFNCSVFIPWNDKDEQSAARREALLQLVRNDVFRRWSLHATSGLPFFRDSIQSIPDLEDQLKDVLHQLRIQVGKGVMERATKDTIPRRIDTEIARPVMTHK